jgi:peptide methionine sulfoxide reductase msrA/msrB
VITYEGLLQALWRTANPTDAEGQYVDRGRQYRPAIFYHDQEQKLAAEASVKALEESGRYDAPVVIEIVPFKVFYEAEEYHQDYYKKNPLRYKYYTFNSGRYQFIESVWGEDRKWITPGIVRKTVLDPGRLIVANPTVGKSRWRDSTPLPLKNRTTVYSGLG